MNPLLGSSAHAPLSSVSEPPSPNEEDLAKASAWDDEDTSTLVSARRKGKGKQRSDDDDDDDDDDDGTVNGDTAQHQPGAYPPIPDEELESRKVEQNLKRWETLEKQRRKKARDSRVAKPPDSSSPTTLFAVSDVTRRASQLWNGRSKPRANEARPRARTSGHKMLEDVEETGSLPMDEAGPPSASSPADTPRTSTADTPRASSSDNPFDDPVYQDPQPDAMMAAANPGSLPPTPKAAAEKGATPQRPILEVTPGSFGKHPPPQPLDLPAPMSQTERAQQEQLDLEREEEAKPRKWWTEWLCGLREGGDDQAGRTNPME